MKHLYIIRHGETEFNKTKRLQGRGINASLNEKGRLQADAVAAELQSYPIQKIVTSSLVRTHESAQPLAESKNINIESWAELDEMSFGDFEGEPFYEVLDHLKYCKMNGRMVIQLFLFRVVNLLKRYIKEQQKNLSKLLKIVLNPT